MDADITELVKKLADGEISEEEFSRELERLSKAKVQQQVPAGVSYDDDFDELKSLARKLKYS